MFSCPGCGGEMRFDPASQKLVCAFCDKQLTVHEYVEANPKGFHKVEEHKDFTEPEVTETEDTPRKEFQTYIYTCPQCGGEILAEDMVAATFCTYCGCSTVLERKLGTIQSPDFVIPFSKTKEECTRAYKGLLARSVFAPKSFREDDAVERFRGIYMPYWIYAYDKKGRVTTKGEREYRRGDYIYTDHYDISFDVEENCAGLSHDAASNFSDNLSASIAPYDMEQAQYFDAGYLSGFYADVCDVDSFLYESDGKDMMAATSAMRASGMLHTKSMVDTKDLTNKLRPEVSHVNLGYFPVWFLANQNKKGDRVSYAVVNGQTGRIAAEIPIDYKKFLLGTLILAIPVFLLLNMFFTMKPFQIAVAAIILAVVSWIISAKQNARLAGQEKRLDDRGYMSVHTPQMSEKERRKAMKASEIKVEKKNRSVGSIIVSSIVLDFAIATAISFIADMDTNWLSELFTVILGFYASIGQVLIIIYTIYRCANRNSAKIKRKRSRSTAGNLSARDNLRWLRPFGAIVICVIMIFTNSIYDALYYGAVIIAMCLIAWDYIDIIHYHNRLTSRPLPQLDKREGEEYENI